MDQVKGSRWLVYISIFIALGLVAYSLSYYFAISNKKSNNIFYIFVAIPVLLVVLGKYRASIFLLKDIYWFFIIILFLSFLDMEQIKDAKRGGYLILLFFSCVFIDQGKGHLKNWLLLYAIFSFLCLYMRFLIGFGCGVKQGSGFDTLAGWVSFFILAFLECFYVLL